MGWRDKAHRSSSEHWPDPVQKKAIPYGLSRSGHWGNYKNVYHCTNREAARSIFASGKFRPGDSGMWGPGIYFAETEADARRKAQHATDGRCVIIGAKVWLGFVLEVPEARGYLRQQDVYDYGCHSVRGKANRGYEYVMYDPRNVREIWEVARD
jgi:hypothetical protein